MATTSASSSASPLSLLLSKLSADPTYRSVIFSLVTALLVVRGSSPSFQLPWQESTERRRERKRLYHLTPLSTPMLEKETSDLFIPSADGKSRVLLVPFRGRVSKVRIRDIPASTFKAHVKSFPPVPPGSKLGVNAGFVKQLKALLLIILPRWRCRETLMLVLHSVFLVQRTLLSVFVAKLDGRIVRDLIQGQPSRFARGLLLWFALALPSTYTNAMLAYLQNKLALAFRTRLTRYVHDLYLSDRQTYYKLGLGLGAASNGEQAASGGPEGGAADQFITEDLARFCDTLSHLYGNLCKPLLDLVIFTAQLSSSLGPVGTVGLFVNYGATAYILRAVTPAFGKLAAIQARLEGVYRSQVARIGREAEEIAFYRGGVREKEGVHRAYDALAQHCSSIFRIRIAYVMTEDFLIKYLWSAAGYALMSIPIFFSKNQAPRSSAEVVHGDEADDQVGSRTEGYISNRRLLLSLADSGGRLMGAYKDVAELAGYTGRVYSLISHLHALNIDSYPINERPDTLDAEAPFYDMSRVAGKVSQSSDHIKLSGVPIVVPAGAERGGEELINKMDLEIQAGDHLLITGPNGVGKTSLARVLARLWPVWTGSLVLPPKAEIFFLPQRPYLSLGSLLDQVIYPHSFAQMKAAGRTEAELIAILKKVHLEYLPSREGGWQTRKEWKDVLSGGEKQRMGFARVFYHQPSFAILDDCTSAVSTDVEGGMYQGLKDLGVTLLTISHRPSLMKYHTKLLRFTGDSSKDEWELTSLGTEAEALGLDSEIASIEDSLREVDAWKSRLDEVQKALSGNP